MISLRFMKRKVKPETPLQMIVRRFDGLNYLTLTEEEVEIVDTMRRLGYISYNSEGEISATKRGIMDGAIATNYESHIYIGDYLTQQRRLRIVVRLDSSAEQA